MAKKKQNKRDKKSGYLLRLYELLGRYKQIIQVSLDNVGSTQVQQIRRDLHNQKQKGILIIGKNTVLKKAVALRLADLPNEPYYEAYKKLGGKIPELKELLPLIQQRVGFIFTDQSVFEVKNLVEANKISANAKTGTFAQKDVIVPAGLTGLDPSQISFFHALQISTKINKQQIEIQKEYKVCTQGKKIGNSEVALLDKLNIRPFFYAMKVLSAYDDGALLDKQTCELNPDSIIEKFQTGVRNLTALSLESGILSQLSIPHALLASFKNLASIGLEIDYKFAQLQNAGPAQKQGGDDKKKKDEKPVEKKVEKPKEEPKKEEEEEGDFGLDLFG